LESGSPDPSVPVDPPADEPRKGSTGTEGSGEPDSKRARHCEIFQLFVRGFSGETYRLTVTSADTVLMQKIALCHLEGFPCTEPSNLKIIYNGKQLEDGSTLADYDIQGETFMSVVHGIRGGAGSGLSEASGDGFPSIGAGDHDDEAELLGSGELFEDGPPLEYVAESVANGASSSSGLEPPRAKRARRSAPACIVAAIAAPAVAIEDSQ